MPAPPKRHHPPNIPHIIAIIAGISFFSFSETSRSSPGVSLGVGLIAYLAAVLYFVPAIIAYHRNTFTKGRNFLINLVFGWTLLGWVLSLLMAVTAVRPQPITITLPDGRTIDGKIE
jgi:Na+/H+ antiporter NhaC